MTPYHVRVQNVSKSYKKFRHGFHLLLSWLGFKVEAVERFDVLNNVSFQIGVGESVALVGENGAGKSTLLKVITGTTQPSKGNILINGKISAVLELGLGFNNEVSGRQNVHLSAGVMGFAGDEIAAIVEFVREFSELNEYFEQPVRTYSSGMKARLAFSIATAKQPEILIVDEVLSVGDSYFQHKSFKRIKEFRSKGTTLIFVSHDRGSILTLCDRAILLERGFVLKDSGPLEVMDYYNALLAQKENSSNVQQEKTNDGRIITTSGNGAAKLIDIYFESEAGKVVDIINVGESVELVAEVEIVEDLEVLIFGFLIKDRLGIDVFGTNTFYTGDLVEYPKAGKRYLFRASLSANFGIGSFSVSTALAAGFSHIQGNYEWKDLAHTFNVVNTQSTEFVGMSWTDCKFVVEKLG